MLERGEHAGAQEELRLAWPGLGLGLGLRLGLGLGLGLEELRLAELPLPRLEREVLHQLPARRARVISHDQALPLALARPPLSHGGLVVRVSARVAVVVAIGDGMVRVRVRVGVGVGVALWGWGHRQQRRELYPVGPTVEAEDGNAEDA